MQYIYFEGLNSPPAGKCNFDEFEIPISYCRNHLFVWCRPSLEKMVPSL